MEEVKQSKVDKINKIFGKSLINFQLLQLYQQNSGKQLMSEFNKLLAKNKLSDRMKLAAQIAKVLSPLINQTEQSLSQKLSSNKKTDITKKITKILIPQKSIRTQFQAIRVNLVKSIRQNKEVNHQQVEMFKLFYKLITEDDNNLQSLKKQESSDQRQFDKKKLKTLLTSIKKITGIDPKQSFIDSKDRNPYYLNIDIKNILLNVSNQIKSKRVSEKLKQFLTNTKSGKWFGPRLSKQLQAQNWNFQQVRILIQNLKTIKISQKDLQSKVSQVNKIKKKMIQNLQSYINKLLKKSEQSQNDSYEKSQNIEEQSQNQSQNNYLQEQEFQKQKIEHIEKDRQKSENKKEKDTKYNPLNQVQFDDDYALLKFLMEDDRKLFNDGSQRYQNSVSPPKIVNSQIKKEKNNEKESDKQKKRSKGDENIQDIFILKNYEE